MPQGRRTSWCGGLQLVKERGCIVKPCGMRGLWVRSHAPYPPKVQAPQALPASKIRLAGLLRLRQGKRSTLFLTGNGPVWYNGVSYGAVSVFVRRSGIMVLYFSGTGNSQRAAMRIAQRLEDGLVSINQCLKEHKKGDLRSEGPWVFVAPTYAWRMPRAAEEWIRAAELRGSRDAYFVLTCGGSCAAAGARAEKLCAEKGLRFMGLAPVVMPENYLAMFPTPDEEECRAILERAEPRFAALAEEIRGRRPFPAPRLSLADRACSGLVNPLFYRLFVHDKGFTASEGCVSCGKCAERCPLNNIELAGGRPVWKGACTHCMACIAGCPAGTIEYKENSRGRRRYYIMRETQE